MTSVLAQPHAYPTNRPYHELPVPTLESDTAPTTSSKDPVHRGPVTATLNFYTPPPDGAPPHNYVDPPPGTPQRNFPDQPLPVELSDARGREGDFVLETQAFALLKGHPHNDKIDWSSDESIEKIHYPEVEALLKHELPSLHRIILFDHTVRRATPGARRAPVTRAHIDQTPKSAAQRVRFHAPEEAEKLLAGRYRIINVWRPLNGPVETSPLTFADSATVKDEDMVGVEHRYPDRTGETAAVRWRPEQKWWYWSGIDNDERILLQCFDSEKPMNRVPHSAFVEPRAGEGAKGRDSIEVRALVFG